MKRIACVLTIGLLGACSQGEGAGTDTAGTDTAGTDTDSLTPEEAEICACLDDGSCGEEVCPSVGKQCDVDCYPDDPVSDEAALECALLALRDRTPGKIGWFQWAGGFGGKVDVYIRADATAVVHNEDAADLCSYYGPDSLHPLKEPAYYDGCLAMADANDRLNCLKGGLGDETAVCSPQTENCGGL